MQVSIGYQHLYIVFCVFSSLHVTTAHHVAFCTVDMVDPGLLTLAPHPDISELSGFTLEGAVLQMEEQMVLFQLQREMQGTGKKKKITGSQADRTAKRQHAETQVLLLPEKMWRKNTEDKPEVSKMTLA